MQEEKKRLEEISSLHKKIKKNEREDKNTEETVEWKKQKRGLI